MKSFIKRDYYSCTPWGLISVGTQLFYCIGALLLPAAKDSVFGPALRGSAILIGISIGVILPIAAVYRLFKRLSGAVNPLCLALGFVAYISCMPIILYWVGYLVGFNGINVSLTITCLSLIIFIIGDHTAQCLIPSGLQDYSPPIRKSEFIPLAIILIAFAICVTIPFSYIGRISSKGACLAAIGDYIALNSITASILASGVPPHQPYFCSSLLNYYYFYHLLTAMLVILTGYSLNITLALQCILVLTSCSLLYGFYVFVRSWLRSWGAALLALALVTFIGGLDLIPLTILRLQTGEWLRHADAWEHWQLFKIHCPLTNFHYYPHHMVAAFLCVAYIYLISKKYTSWVFLAASVLLSAIYGYSSLIFLGIIISVLLKIFVDLIMVMGNQRPSAHEFAVACKELLRRAAEGSLALVLILPHAMLSLTSQSNSPMKIICRLPSLATMKILPSNFSPSLPLYHLFGLAMMEFLDFGAVALLGLLGIIYIRRWRDSEAKRYFLAMTLGMLIFINLFQTTNIPMAANEFPLKLSALSWIGMALFAALFWRESGASILAALTTRYNKRTTHRTVLFGLICSFFVCLGALTVPFELSSLCIPDTLDTDEYQACMFLRDRTPWNSVVQRAPDINNIYLAIPNWGWRVTRAGDYCGIRRWGTRPSEQQQTVRAIDSAFRAPSAEEAHAKFRALRIDYLYIGQPEAQRYGARELEKFDRRPDLFKKVFDNALVRILQRVDGPRGAVASTPRGASSRYQLP